jgi:hypothetical protein
MVEPMMAECLIGGSDQANREGAVLLERHLVEKTEGAHRDLDRTGCKSALADQICLVGANLLRTEVRR